MPLPYSAPAVLYSPPLGQSRGADGDASYASAERGSRGKKGPFRRKASPPAPPSPRRLQRRIRRWFPWARNGGNAFGIPVSPETAGAGWGERRKNSGSMLDGRILFSPPHCNADCCVRKNHAGRQKNGCVPLFFVLRRCRMSPAQIRLFSSQTHTTNRNRLVQQASMSTVV